MWVAKISIIAYIFAIGILFAGAYLDFAFDTDTFSGTTFDTVEALALSYTVNEEFSADMIFGDFLAGLEVIAGLITGQVITDALNLIPEVNLYWHLFVRLLFSLASVFLVLYIVTGKSL